ncbi:hypothetical protein [Candidiatus Paracoxiella cheracis]|uniref:hypothetical protein n=1 Tax=Candidiatus Paracoxiella cheracis TaxID=3405120 RepID=UPI003BF4705D
MPQVDVKYSDDLKLKHNDLFDAIETTINTLDSSAGVCKSRAYPAIYYKHSHVLIEIWLLPKPHRDRQFTQKLIEELQNTIKNCIPQHAYISLRLSYTDENYRTVE